MHGDMMFDIFASAVARSAIGGGCEYSYIRLTNGDLSVITLAIDASKPGCFQILLVYIMGTRSLK